MTIFIGITVFVLLVIALVLWVSRRDYKAGDSGQDVGSTARRTKTKAQDEATRWGAGT